MNCIQCNLLLKGNQRKFCSRKCSNLYFFETGKMVNFQKKLSVKRKMELVKIFGGGCKNCGYNKNLRALSFHHIDKSQKLFSLSKEILQSRKWSDILEESRKCQLLCLNCHAETHAEEDGTYIYNESYFMDVPIDRDGLNKNIKLFNCQYCNKEYKPYGAKSKFCNDECYKKSLRKVKRPSKEELMEMLKTNSYYALGKKFKVSDNTIRKWLNSPY